MLLQTQTFWALVAALFGSALEKVTSVSAVICARFGTVAVMVMLPVEVAPSVPCVAALARPAVAAANNAASAILVKSEDMIADPRFELGLGTAESTDPAARAR